MKKISAYLSVFASMTITVLLALYFVLLEAVRENTLRMETECILDIGMNSVLAEYHREIYKRYNLFYIDSSYGTDYPSFYNTEAHLRDYLNENISIEAISETALEDRWFSEMYLDLLDMKIADVEIDRVSLATDNSGYNLQRQAVKVKENEVGIGMLEEVQSWVTVIEENFLLNNVVDEKIADLEKQLCDIRGETQSEEGIWVSVPVENPAEEVFLQRKKGLVWWIAGLLEDISPKMVDTKVCVSSRKESGKINQGNLSEGNTLSLYERVAFQEYLMEYAGAYGNVRENSALDYQIEYLLYGENADINNLKKTVASICGLREAANLIYIWNDEEKRAVAKGIAAIASTAILAPEAEPVLEGIVLVAWSCIESIRDVKALLNGECIPLIKGRGENDYGLQYEDYLRILLYFSDVEKVTYRFMDIIEMDIRRTPGNAAFRLDGCIDFFEAEISVESGYGHKYTISHAKGYR